jgi:hypothetical protein
MVLGRYTVNCTFSSVCGARPFRGSLSHPEEQEKEDDAGDGAA